MNFEIHKPELVERVTAQMDSGHFRNVDELREKALDALDDQAGTSAPTTAESGATLLAVLRESPYPEIDLTPPRVRLPVARDVTL